MFAELHKTIESLRANNTEVMQKLSHDEINAQRGTEYGANLQGQYSISADFDGFLNPFRSI